MKATRFLALLATFSVSSALAANPEWDQATRLYHAGDYKGALAAFRKIADKAPSEPTVHYMLAQCYNNSGNTKQAIIELEWISKSTKNMRVKGPADALLAQLKASGAVSPNQNSGTNPSAGTAAALANDQPPSKDFINDSASATVSAAARKGWTPCRNKDCLNFGTTGWHHADFPGHPATDNWMDCPRDDGTPGTHYTQQHIGDLIKDGSDVGPCPVCKGTGWIKSR